MNHRSEDENRTIFGEDLLSVHVTLCFSGNILFRSLQFLRYTLSGRFVVVLDGDSCRSLGKPNLALTPTNFHFLASFSILFCATWKTE